MRSLTQPRLLVVSLPAGAALAVLCFPLILAETQSLNLRALQLATLPALCVLLIQAALAWTPVQARRLPGVSAGVPLQRWAEVAVLAIVAAGLRVLTDLWLRHLLFVPDIGDWAAFWRKLPFTCLVQPLLLVVAVYAFTFRLSARVRWTLAAVLLAHQAVVALQFGRLLPTWVLAGMLLAAGIQGLMAAVSYERHGASGPVVLAAVSFARHVVYLLLPIGSG